MKLHNEMPMMPVFSKYADSYIKLTKNRMIFLNEDVGDEMAAQLCALLLYFDHQDPEAPIELFINTNGGSISSLLKILGVMQLVNSPIKTICLGKCYSAGAVILAAGSPGLRYALKNSSVMLHGSQFIFPLLGQETSSSKSYLKFVESNNDNLMKILSKHTGQPLAKVKEDCKNDLFLTAQEALAYGVVDKIL